MGQLFGPLRGGLGYSVIIVGFILGAITGTVAAQVIAMALISLPVMMRYKYNMRYATGVLAASGTITQLVPPSLVLIVLADQLGRSVGDMYLGAWGPSLLQVRCSCCSRSSSASSSRTGCRRCRRRTCTLHGWALWRKCLVGHHPRRRADLPRARHAAAGPRDADRGRRDGHRSARSCSRSMRHPGARPRRQAHRVLDRHRRPPASRRSSASTRSSRCRSRSRSRVLYVAVVYLLRARARPSPTCASSIRRAYETTMRLTAMVIFILIGSTCFSIVFQGVDGGPLARAPADRACRAACGAS